MAETTEINTTRVRRIRHRGRLSQISIYLGKQMRFFVNENGWKVIPMAAIIAGLVAMVIRKRFFVDMEGSLIGGFALSCVAIWNGCFNSIQVVCRERAIIKREHRSGMHISSYMAAHMIYQLGICLIQTGVTIYVMKLVGVRFPEKGFMTPWIMLDIGITMLLITYAADMMSLFLSSITRTTTSAMTVMPFVLIFQLVFSGGIIPLPEWVKPVTNYTISNYGVKALASQSGYNELPLMTAWNLVDKMRDKEVGGSINVGEILDGLQNPALDQFRDKEIVKPFTVGEIADIISSADQYLNLRDRKIISPVSARKVLELLNEASFLKSFREKRPLGSLTSRLPTYGELIQKVLDSEELQGVLDKEIGTTVTVGQVMDRLKLDEMMEENKDITVNKPITLGQIFDFITTNEALQKQRDKTFTFSTTIGGLIEMIGEDTAADLLQNRTAEASRKEEYRKTAENIMHNWLMLGAFILGFALLATIALELIDKDKR